MDVHKIDPGQCALTNAHAHADSNKALAPQCLIDALLCADEEAGILLRFGIVHGCGLVK